MANQRARSRDRSGLLRHAQGSRASSILGGFGDVAGLSDLVQVVVQVYPDGQPESPVGNPADDL